jgi:hypothetical protein
VADIAVGVGRTMRVLAGLAHEGRRRDDRRIAGGARVGLVGIERIVVADRQREVTDRGAADLLGRCIADLAPDPSSKLVCQQRVN